MKNFRVLFAAFITVAVVAFTGCDPCKKVECQNGAACVDGTCNCPAGFGGEFCEVDSCSLITCLNGATCDAGECICATGYEGSDCGTESRAKFVGTFSANSDCVSSGSYSVIVTNSASEIVEVEIENLFNLKNQTGSTDKVVGTISGTDLTISSQNITVNGAQWTVSGSGAYASTGSIQVNYVVTDQFGNDNICAEGWSK